MKVKEWRGSSAGDGSRRLTRKATRKKTNQASSRPTPTTMPAIAPGLLCDQLMPSSLPVTNWLAICAGSEEALLIYEEGRCIRPEDALLDVTSSSGEMPYDNGGCEASEGPESNSVGAEG